MLAITSAVHLDDREYFCLGIMGIGRLLIINLVSSVEGVAGSILSHDLEYHFFECIIIKVMVFIVEYLILSM